jgi:hypothetical protein
MTIRKLRLSVFVVWILCFGLCRVYAQSGQADVEGIVADSSGAVIVNAQVTLRNMDSGDTRVVTTPADGRYRFPTVAPGRYSISGKAPSFAGETVSNLVIELAIT